MEKRRGNKKFLITVTILIVLAIIPLGLWLQERAYQGEGSIFLIPKGYTGEVSIHYGQEDSPPLPKEGEYILHEVPETGNLKTSTAEPPIGIVEQKFYYVDQQGTRTELSHDQIHGVGVGSEGTKPPVKSFFVGTNEQWNEWVKKMEEKNKGK